MFLRIPGQKPAGGAARRPALAPQPSFLPLRLQPKLTLGPVADPYEREADGVAERVVGRVPGPLGLSSVGAASVQRQEDAGSTPVEPHVAAGIQRSRGGGRSLPEPVRGTMERSFGTDFSRVRVHDDARSDQLNQSLEARAFTTGRDIFFRHAEYRPESRPGQRLLAHELTHVVQQGAAGGPGAGVVQRVPFQGPQFVGGNLVNQFYFAHLFNLGPAKAKTGCGTDNSIRTAGEKLNNTTSKPGNPIGMKRYRTGFSRPGGLVKDKTLNNAATRMHLINHRLENSKNTQRNPQNIMLGTQKSNNPIHLNQVEQPVIDAVTNHGRGENFKYETAMLNAVRTTDAATQLKKILFWPTANLPPDAAVKNAQLDDVYLRQDDPVIGVSDPGAKKKNANDNKGYALEVTPATPANHYRHLWLEYRVRANYGARPAYVNANIVHEQNQNNANPAGSKKQSITDRIKEFNNFWADAAFPPDFDCEVSYYSATYDPWNGTYRKEQENHNIQTDN